MIDDVAMRWDVHRRGAWHVLGMRRCAQFCGRGRDAVLRHCLQTAVGIALDMDWSLAAAHVHVVSATYRFNPSGLPL
jgi:hypothetical protein